MVVAVFVVVVAALVLELMPCVNVIGALLSSFINSALRKYFRLAAFC